MLVPVDKLTYNRAWMRLLTRPVPPASATVINSWIVGDADRTSSEHGIPKWDDGQMVDDTAIIVTLLPGEGAESLPVNVRPEDIEDALAQAMNAMSEHSVQCRDCTVATDAGALCKEGFVKLSTVFKLRGMLDQAVQGQAGSSQAAQGQAGSSQAAQGQAGSSQAAQGQAGSSQAAQGQAGSSQAAQGQAGSSQAADSKAG